MESTYGNRVHTSPTDSVDELKKAILETLERGGNGVIPTFALERAQDLLYFLRELEEQRALPRYLSVFSEGTLARRIMDGQNPVHIYGEEVRVAARVYTIGGFSAHADQQELLNWHQRCGTPAITFLVHGEEAGRAALAQVLRGQGLRVEAPALHERYRMGASD